MINNKVLLLLAILLSITNLFAQDDTIIYNAHKIVGDTTFLIDKQQYNLFPNISSDGFKYSQYISINNNIILRVTSIDGTHFDYPYTIEQILKDGNKINLGQNIVNKATRVNSKQKIFLKITNYKNHKTNYIKEKQTCYITKYSDLETEFLNEQTYNKKHLQHNQGIEAKIKTIINNNVPSIEVEIYSGMSKRTEIIPINQIKYISRKSSTKKVLGIGMIAVGASLSLATFTNTPAGYIAGTIGIGSIITGISTIVKENRIFDTDKNCDIQIIYK